MNDGGQAFPGLEYTLGHGGVKFDGILPNGEAAWSSRAPGMTLLDYMAGQAPEPGISELAGALGVPESTPKEPYQISDEMKRSGVKCARELYDELPWLEKLAMVARYKYAHADAMLAERARRYAAAKEATDAKA